MEADTSGVIRGQPGHRRHPRPLLLATAAAVAVVTAIALVVGLSAVRRPPVAAWPAPAAMPRYYVTVDPLETAAVAVVHDSANGQVTGTARLPDTRLSSIQFVAAAAGGRTFVIAIDLGDALIEDSYDWRYFRLTISANGRPGQPAVVHAPEHIPVTGMALSPDGTMLAASLALPTTDEFVTYGGLAVMNLATGKTRTWTAHGDVNDWPGTPTWTRGDSQVSVPWWHRVSLPSHAPLVEVYTESLAITGVRVFDTSAAGTSLLRSRLIRFPSPVRDVLSAVITSDGRDIIATSCRDLSPSGARHRTAVARTIDLSATDGRPLRVLRTQTATFPGYQDEYSAFTTCDVLSVAAAGQHVLVQAFSFGRIDDGVFAALPGPLLLTAAW